MPVVFGSEVCGEALDLKVDIEVSRGSLVASCQLPTASCPQFTEPCSLTGH